MGCAWAELSATWVISGLALNWPMSTPLAGRISSSGNYTKTVNSLGLIGVMVLPSVDPIVNQNIQ